MAPFTLRWGIISTGVIATQFSEDLLVDPSTRKVHDVSHKIAAIGSRSTKAAQDFINKLKTSPGDHSWGVKQGLLNECKAYGSYEEVFDNPDVDAVYIGTPHNFHHANAKAALLGGKHVCCEKPFTFDIEELDELIAIAEEKKLFLMEAVWTRFHPIAYAVQDVIFSGKLGPVKSFSAEFCVDTTPDKLPLSSRMIAPELAGGSLLDMGPYPSAWAMLIMHQHPENKDRKAPEFVMSVQTIYPRTKVDAASRWLLRWEGLGEAVLTTDFVTEGFADSTCLIRCQEGDLVIEWPPYKPSTFHIVPHAEGRPGSIRERSTHHYPIPTGAGMSYEADEVARCIRDKKLESKRMPWSESRIVQSWFDKIRKEGSSCLRDVRGSAGQ